MDNILLAGANGFIGTFLYNHLKNDYSIISTDYSEGFIEKDIYHLNLTVKEEVESFVDKSPKCDALIFLVGLAHKKGKGKDLHEFRSANLQTLINLLSMLDIKNKLPDKIIFSSTISVYGEKINQVIYPEDSEKTPLSPYAVTKLEAEEYLLNNYSTQAWILRFAPVYSSNFQLNIIRRTKIGDIFFRVGDGKKQFSLCNLENIGRTIQRILENKVPSGVYNISDAKHYTYFELLNYVNAKWILHIPKFLVKGLYYVGKMINNIFLIENTTKLISDNIFPSNKLNQFTELPSELNDCEQC